MKKLTLDQLIRTTKTRIPFLVLAEPAMCHRFGVMPKTKKPEQSVEKPTQNESKPNSQQELNHELFIAIVYDSCNLSRIKNLIENGADANARDNGDEPALIFAIRHSNEDVAKLLIKKGSDVNAKSEHGKTALIYAIGHRKPEFSKQLSELLIEKGADVDASYNDWTPLMTAFHYGRTKTAELLINAGADVNARGNGDEIPLNFAIRYRHEDVAILIIKKGADVNARDDGGYTPLKLAKISGNKKIEELLLKHGAKEEPKPKRSKKKFLLATAFIAALGLAALYPKYELHKAEQVVSTLSNQQTKSPDDFKKSIKYLIKALESDDKHIQNTAVKLLGLIGTPVIQPLIEILYNEKELPMRWTVGRILVNIGESALKPLEASMGSSVCHNGIRICNESRIITRAIIKTINKQSKQVQLN